jgi:GNAT superfamily N-acetyltransferase
VRLRTARADDVEIIARYHHRCWREGYIGLVDPLVLDVLEVEPFVIRWRAVLTERPHDVIVATIDDRPIGHAAIDGPVLTSLYVDPDHWRQGIGRLLLGSAEEALAARGVSTGELWTVVGNERALALYRATGWEPDGRVEDHRSSAGVITREMRLLKPLAGRTNEEQL